MKKKATWILIAAIVICVFSGCSQNGDVTPSTEPPAESVPSDPAKSFVDLAYELELGQTLPEPVTLTGVVTIVNHGWNEEQNCITVTIQPESKRERPFMCIEMQGTDIRKVVMGDTITVTGIVKNHEGTIRFEPGCIMESRISAQQVLREKIGGKQFSILGDSISTFEGYSNNTDYNLTIGDNWVWYTGNNAIRNVNETWWMQAIHQTGIKLLVNNSFSSDEVANRGVNRALQLHNTSNVQPDIIAVYMGINDFLHLYSVEDFAAAYEQTIQRMQNKYASADIFLFTLLPTKDAAQNQRPEDVEAFNDVIRELAAQYDCALVDLYAQSGITQDTLAQYTCDGSLHPNAKGMDAITQCFVNALICKYVL